MPHQAALEYQENRLNTIVKQLEVYDEIEKLVEENKKKLKNKLDSLSNRHPYIKPTYLLKVMQKACDNIEKKLKKLKEKYPDLSKYDNLRDVLDNLLKGKIGKPYSQKKLYSIYDLGEKRYEQKIPPGYEDNHKEGAKRYGDVVLWFQIIDKAKKENRSIILVTDDRKGDWWWRLKNKTISPRPELVNEIFSEAGASFYLYQTDPFMKNAQKFLKQQVKKKAIDEIREVREQDEEHDRMMVDAAMASIALTDSLSKMGNLTSSINLPNISLNDLTSSIKLPNISLNDLTSSINLPNISLNDLTSSINLPNDIISEIQVVNNSLSTLGKYFGKIEDGKLYENIESKENNKNEKDNQKEK